jgi:hypothetical protein
VLPSIFCPEEIERKFRVEQVDAKYDSKGLVSPISVASDTGTYARKMIF